MHRNNQRQQTHKCPCLGCTKQIEMWRLVCLDHYRLIPDALRDGLSKQWQYCKAQRLRSSEELVSMQRACIAAANDALRARAARAEAKQARLSSQVSA